MGKWIFLEILPISLKIRCSGKEGIKEKARKSQQHLISK